MTEDWASTAEWVKTMKQEQTRQHQTAYKKASKTDHKGHRKGSLRGKLRLKEHVYMAAL